MKTAGFVSGDYRAERIIGNRGNAVIRLEDVPMLAVFNVYSVEEYFHGPRHEPRLRINGELERVVPAWRDMPFDIRQLSFDPESRQEVTADYIFNAEQLSVLVDKGLYLDGFAPPREVMTTNKWEIPISGDMIIVPPLQPGGPPIISVDVSEVDQVEMTVEKHGYDLAEIYVDYAKLAVEGTEMPHAPGEMVDSADFDNLFDESIFDEKGEKTIRIEEKQEASAFDVPIKDLYGHKLSADRHLEVLAARQGEVTAAELARLEAMNHHTAWEREIMAIYNENLSLDRQEEPETVFGEDLDLDDVDFSGVDLDDLDVGDLGDDAGGQQSPALGTAGVEAPAAETEDVVETEAEAEVDEAEDDFNYPDWDEPADATESHAEQSGEQSEEEVDMTLESAAKSLEAEVADEGMFLGKPSETMTEEDLERVRREHRRQQTNRKINRDRIAKSVRESNGPTKAVSPEQTPDAPAPEQDGPEF